MCLQARRKIELGTNRGNHMRAALVLGILLVSVVGATADTCRSTATEKKLSGAALNSFMTKCQKDASAACDVTASQKKLAGAAKSSFTKKCVTDAVGQ
jgi:ribosomal protein L12E/L44/L45/RPP1/RPP2